MKPENEKTNQNGKGEAAMNEALDLSSGLEAGKRFVLKRDVTRCATFIRTNKI